MPKLSRRCRAAKLRAAKQPRLASQQFVGHAADSLLTDDQGEEISLAEYFAIEEELSDVEKENEEYEDKDDDLQEERWEMLLRILRSYQRTGLSRAEAMAARRGRETWAQNIILSEIPLRVKLD